MDRKDEIILQQLDVIRTMTQNSLNRMGSDFWGAPPVQDTPKSTAPEKGAKPEKTAVSTGADEKKEEEAPLPPPEKIEDLLAELDEAVYMYRERAISENKHLDFEEPESISPVLADKNRMRQVFVNVIDNALKYTPEDGMVSIRVQEDEKFIHIYIVDNGCGIPAEHLPRVKDKFYKANQTQRGSGIGLAVADEIMTLHSGSLQIESEEGVGTTVIISIPKIQPDKGAQKQE